MLVDLTMSILAWELPTRTVPPKKPRNDSELSVAMVPEFVQVSIQRRWFPTLLKKRKPGSPNIVPLFVKNNVCWDSNGKGTPVPLTVVTLNGARFNQA